MLLDTPVDPLGGPKLALEGRVVTMDANFTVLDRGIVYVDAGRIVDVRPTDAPPPADFADHRPLKTGGTIYPGLIDLHNHLSYDALTMFAVPQPYTNNGQWRRAAFYQKLITRPMQLLGQLPGYVEAVVRYVECKCLMGGVTTSQGIALFSNQGIMRYYRGIVRNVEQTDDASLPEAATRISDVEASRVDRFLARLQRSTCLLLHLSEGIDQRAHEHFEALQMPDGTWAITPALAGIHSLALTAADFDIMQDNGAAMIWSPLSNLLLYGQTADVRAAKASGIRLALGSDWSPSGSKNLLGELKVARLVSGEMGGLFSDRELLAMATCDAAAILRWQTELGSIEAGKRADLLVVYGRRNDPYSHLMEARETQIILVVINGVPRYGRTGLMDDLGIEGEAWQVHYAQRRLNLAQATADPVVGALTLGQARDRLADGLARLPELDEQFRGPGPLGTLALDQQRWFLVLDHNEPEGIAIRAHLPFHGRPTAPREPLDSLALAALTEPLEPQQLDPLTVAEDDGFFDKLDTQPNLPAYVKAGLPALF